MNDEGAKVQPGYLISFTKQTGALGEMITIQTNLPVGAGREAIASELVKIGAACDDRMRALNADVLKRTGKNLADMGLVAESILRNGGAEAQDAS